MCKEQKSNINPRTFHKERLGPYLFGVIGNNIIEVFCFQLVMAILMRDLFNAAMAGNKDLFFRAILIALSSLLIALLIRPFLVYIANKATKKIMKEIRLKTYNHLTQLPISYFEREHSGGIMSRLTNDIKIIEDIYQLHIPRICFIILLGVGSAILMFIFDWRLALYAVLFEAVSILTGVLVTRKIRRISVSVQRARSHVNENFINIITGFKTTKIFQLEAQVLDDYKEANDDLTNRIKRRDQLDALVNTIGELFYSIKSFGIIAIGIYMVSKEMIEIGTLAALFNLHNNVGILSRLGDTLSKLQFSMAGLNRVAEFIEEEPEIHKSSSTPGETRTDSAIELKDICFGYDEKPIINNLSISVKKGESIALVGKSGSGKSTIGKLLLGFHQTNMGELSINGNPVSQYSLQEWRDQISYVPQDPYLFDGTIRDNIRLGRLDCGEEEIISAAKMANAHDFILEQEAGYDTYIGEGGEKLSGGQMQRIAIARAINKGASILLLDEATSALDSVAVEKVQGAIERIMLEKTVLIITHQLKTVNNVDKIYWIDEGKVRAWRSLEELLGDGQMIGN